MTVSEPFKMSWRLGVEGPWRAEVPPVFLLRHCAAVFWFFELQELLLTMQALLLQTALVTGILTPNLHLCSLPLPSLEPCSVLGNSALGSCSVSV